MDMIRRGLGQLMLATWHTFMITGKQSPFVSRRSLLAVSLCCDACLQQTSLAGYR
jgi:hypothetical protein